MQGRGAKSCCVDEEIVQSQVTCIGPEEEADN
jgi:hypothetical protein